MPDQDKPTQGDDVKNLFGALELDSDRYKNTVQDQRRQVNAEAVASRWPLLGELRESLTQQPQKTGAPTGPSSAASVAPAPSEAQAPPTPPEQVKRWDIANEFDGDAPAASTTPSAKQPSPQPVVAENPTDDEDKLAQVFGLQDEPVPPPATPVPPTVVGHGAGTERDAAPTVPESPQRGNAAVADASSNLESLFDRLRNSDGPGRTEQAPAPKLKPKPSGLSALFDRFRRK